MTSTNIPVTKIHSYNVSVAADVGINAAVVFYNICFWVEENHANRRNFINGKYWTYNTVKALHTIFPEMTGKQIEYALKKLKDGGYVESAILSEDTRDRTNWYTVCDFKKWILHEESSPQEKEVANEEKEVISENSEMHSDNSAMFNNIYNNINSTTDNNQSNKNQPTNDSHEADTLKQKDVLKARADTPVPKKRLPERAPKKKTKSELKELEAGMIERFSEIGAQYDVSNIAYENVVNAFKYYLVKYTERTGKIHPILTDKTLERVFETLATVEDTEWGHFDNAAEEDYLELVIDAHFESKHKQETDWHISHFSSSDYLEKLTQRFI